MENEVREAGEVDADAADKVEMNTKSQLYYFLYKILIFKKTHELNLTILFFYDILQIYNENSVENEEGREKREEERYKNNLQVVGNIKKGNGISQNRKIFSLR